MSESSSIGAFPAAFFKYPCCIKLRSFMHLHTVLAPKSLPVKTRKATCSHFCPNSTDNHVLCQVDTKLKYLMVATVYITNSQFPSPVKSFCCQKHVKMPKGSPQSLTLTMYSRWRRECSGCTCHSA